MKIFCFLQVECWSSSFSTALSAPLSAVTIVIQDWIITATISPWKNHTGPWYSTVKRKRNVYRKLVKIIQPLKIFIAISVLDRNEGEMVVFRMCSHLHFPNKCNDDQVGLDSGRSPD